jgi:hypothetical protein
MNSCQNVTQEQAKMKRNKLRFASFRFEAKILNKAQKRHPYQESRVGCILNKPVYYIIL